MGATADSRRESRLVGKQKRQRRLGQLLAFAHRTVHVKFDHFKQRFSARKLIPINVKSLGDYLLLKRIEADLSQPELAVKSGVSVRKVKAWEYDYIAPTEAEWQVLAGILYLDSTFPKS
jgi:ribosome-binding protein aMBF1 (putative translation factor)